MTTNDINSVQILIKSNDGKILIGATTDAILVNMIASFVKFVELDERKLQEIPIKDILKHDNNNNNKRQ